MDIKETMEVLDGVVKILEEYKAAMEDGSIGVLDIPKLLPVFFALKSGLTGIGLVPAELKDLDDEELAAIFAKMTEITSMIIGILQPKEG